MKGEWAWGSHLGSFVWAHSTPEYVTSVALEKEAHSGRQREGQHFLILLQEDAACHPTLPYSMKQPALP